MDFCSNFNENFQALLFKQFANTSLESSKRKIILEKAEKKKA